MGMADLPAQAPEYSRKRSSLDADLPDPKRRKEDHARRTYDNSSAQHNSRAHFGDSHHSHAYHNSTIYHSSDGMHSAVSGGPSAYAKRREVLASLDFDQMDDRYLTIHAAHAKTCQWLFERQEYQDWLDGEKRAEHSGFLWIKGKPGAGKSTLMKSAYQHAQKSMKDTTLVSFFFNARGNALEKSTEGMYRSLLHQAMIKIPRLQSLLDRQRQRDNWPVELLSSLFREAVMSLDQHRLTCYIDALDEGDEDEIRSMIQVVQDLTDPEVTSCRDFRICFSSRHYPQISLHTYQELILDDQEGHDDDIASYVQNQLRGLKISPDLKSETGSDITQRASGIFLWVVLVLRILIKDCDRGHAHKIKDRLRQIPDGLENLFKDIIQRGKQEDTYLVPTLQWIMFAERPLTCVELYNAILYTPTDEPERLGGLKVEKLDPGVATSFLLDSSKGLAEFTKSKKPTVQFIHESVRDYLHTTGFGALSADLSDNILGVSHDYLTQRCLQFISEEIRRHVSMEESLAKAKSREAKRLRAQAHRSFPFLDYAVSNVLHHAEQACEHGAPQHDFVHAFPLSTWRVLNNLFEKHTIRRYTTAVTKTYAFAQMNAPHLLKILIDQEDADFSRGQERLPTALEAAIHYKHSGPVTLLLEHGACESCSDDALKGMFESAVKWRAPKILKLLESRRNSTASENVLEALLDGYLRDGNAIAIQFLIEHGMSLKPFEEWCDLALATACYDRHVDLIWLLLNRGADVNARSSSRHVFMTPLRAACFNLNPTSPEYLKMLEVIRALLAKGANANAETGPSMTPLVDACKHGCVEVVDMLIRNGADVHVCGQTWGDALQSACQYGSEQIVKALLEAGAEVNARGWKGQSALRAARDKGNERIVKLLLDQGAKDD